MILGIDAITLQGGGIIHLKNVIENSKFSKFKKIIIWGNKQVLKNIPNNKKIIKKNYIIFEKNFIFVLIWKFFNFNRLIKNENCKCVLYLSGYYFNNFKPSVVFMQNILPFDNKALNYYNFFYRIKFKILKYLSIYSLKKASHIIFPSKYFQNLLKKNNISFSSSFVYHGGTKRFKISRKIKKIKLVYVSSFEPFKNHLNLLIAISNINKFKEIYLDLYGPKNFFFFNKVLPLIKKINQNKKIIFYRGFKGPNFIYKNYNLSIYPSLSESFGLPIIESLASGVPVACSNIPVFKEIYKKKVFYFNPKDIRSIQNSILKAIKIGLYKKIKKNKNINSWKSSCKKIFYILETQARNR